MLVVGASAVGKTALAQQLSFGTFPAGVSGNMSTVCRPLSFSLDRGDIGGVSGGICAEAGHPSGRAMSKQATCNLIDVSQLYLQASQ